MSLSEKQIEAGCLALYPSMRLHSRDGSHLTGYPRLEDVREKVQSVYAAVVAAAQESTSSAIRQTISVPRATLETWNRQLTERSKDIVNPPLLTDGIQTAIAAMLAAAPVAQEPVKVMQKGPTDCMRACLATYFGVAIEEVPPLSDNNWIADVRAWVRPRGLGFITIAVPNEDVFKESFGDGLLIVSGKSARGIDHAVIYKDGKLWHDPHPESNGIDAVEMADFFYPLTPVIASPEATGIEDRELPELGGTYATQGGRNVTMVAIHNPGIHIETLVDNAWVNRYSRRLTDMGRVTGSAHDYTDPNNLVRPIRCLNLKQVSLDMNNSTQPKE